MYSKLDVTSEVETLSWTVIITSFRTLLRKSNLVPVNDMDLLHVVRRKDVSFHDWGMLMHVGSTKTLRHSQYVLELPVHYVPNKVLCAASAVKHHVDCFPAPPDAPLFVKPDFTGKPLLYSTVLFYVKELAQRIGIPPGEVGCHSLRRSGAAHMHRIRIPLEDIMSIGDWGSLSVLDYLVTPRSRKDDIQRLVATSFSYL